MKPVIFSHKSFGNIRTMGTPEKPLFCAADVCNALGYKNGRDAVSKHCETEDVAKCDTPTTSGIQAMTYVNESGLYSLIFGSNLQQAKDFKKWVTADVLPSIRKHGAYMSDAAIERTLTDPDFLIQLATALKEEKQKRLAAEQQVISLAADVASMQPKASYYDTILNNKSTVLITQIAQDYGMSAKAFNKILADIRIQHKVNGQWILYSPYIGQGYVQSKAVDIIRTNGRREIKYNTEWTQKGRLFLYDTLKKNNIIPLIEQ